MELFIKDYFKYFKEHFAVDLEKLEVLPLRKINFTTIFYRLILKIKYIKYYRLHKKARIAISTDAKKVERLFEFMESIPNIFFRNYLKNRVLFHIYKNNIYCFKIVNWFAVPDIIIYRIELKEILDICNNFPKKNIYRTLNIGL